MSSHYSSAVPPVREFLLPKTVMSVCVNGMVGGVLATAAAPLPGGRALGADVDRLLSRCRDVLLWSRLARCEVSFGM